jgi:hypothetical protein
MEIQEILVGPVYFIVLMLFAFAIRTRAGDVEMQKHFLRGLFLKLIGALFVYFVYFFYYKYGDSITYYTRAKYFNNLFFSETSVALKVLFSNPTIFDNETDIHYYVLKASDSSTFLLIKIIGILNIFCFNSYLGISFLLTFLLYYGIWKAYKLFITYFPNHKQNLAYAFLYIPSVFFWGSGLLKDTVTFGLLCLLVSSLHSLFIERKNILINIFFALISIYIVGTIKSYILLALLPAISIWILLIYRNKIRSSFFRSISTPLFIIAGIATGFFILKGLGNTFQKFSVDNIEEKAKGMQRWHTYRVEVLKGGDGASYNLGEVDFTTSGLLKKTPLAINVALFRPYLWEVKNPVMLLSALESFVLLVLTILCVYNFMFNYMKGVRVLNDNPTLIFMLIFALIFAFSVGFTSYNFGALSRYRIPLLPFYMAFVLIFRKELYAAKVVK